MTTDALSELRDGREASGGQTAMSAAKTSRGPRDCLRSAIVSAPCGVCGARPDVVHMPRGEGFYCAEHCEICAPAKGCQH